MYGTSRMRVAEVVKPPKDDDASAPAPTTFGGLMKWLGIYP